MYKHYENLDKAEVKALVELKEKLTMTPAAGLSRLVGKNGTNALSVYSRSKWRDWKVSQRELFREAFPSSVRNKLIKGWFLEIPPHKGFLDVINNWADVPHTPTVICTALKDQTIILNGDALKLKVGEQIGFQLSTVHELKTSKAGQLWACALVLHDPMTLTD